MRVTLRKTADRRDVISVVFTRQSPEADTPEIEAVYFVHFPEDYLITSPVRVLILASVTNVDTREPVQLSDDENKEVMRAAAEYAAGLTLG